ncbi:MAG: hypothetical protein ACRD11_06260 [Terriglobia bacterium]
MSEKGAASVCGLGRFPVTLYYERQTGLLEAADSLRAFIVREKKKEALRLQNVLARRGAGVAAVARRGPEAYLVE